MNTYKCYYNENFFMVCKDISINVCKCKEILYACNIYPIIHIDGKHYVKYNTNLLYDSVNAKASGTFDEFVEECIDILMTRCHINDSDTMCIYIIDDHSTTHLVKDRESNKHFSIIGYDNTSSRVNYMSDLRFEDRKFIEDNTIHPMRINTYRPIEVEMKPYEYKGAL